MTTSDLGGSTTSHAGAPEGLEWVETALRGVYDPELGLDVVSLGLVYDVALESDVVVVTMTLTTPGCPASESISYMAREAVLAADPRAGGDVDVRLVWDPPWNPAMMDDEVAAALGFHVRRDG